jgi:hypothetical protein
MEVNTYQEYEILLKDVKLDNWVAQPVVTSSNQILTDRQLAANFISM